MWGRADRSRSAHGRAVNPSRTTVAVVGAGTMGAGIAHVTALHGFPTALVDQDAWQLQAAMASIARNLKRQRSKGIIDETEAQAALGRIAPTTGLAPALADVRLMIEAVPERMPVKEEIFRTADAHAPPDAILTSNTSSLSITALGALTSRPGQVVGLHFMNPVPVMKLVEVVRGRATSDGTVHAVNILAEELGKEPVEVADFPGFVSNRVLMPMINEAAYALLEGVAEADAIDRVMELGMRHPLGPLALADLIGLDVCLDILGVLHDQLGADRYRPCPLLRKYVEAGWLGRKAGRGFHHYGATKQKAAHDKGGEE